MQRAWMAPGKCTCVGAAASAGGSRESPRLKALRAEQVLSDVWDRKKENEREKMEKDRGEAELEDDGLYLIERQRRITPFNDFSADMCGAQLPPAARTHAVPTRRVGTAWAALPSGDAYGERREGGGGGGASQPPAVCNSLHRVSLGVGWKEHGGGLCPPCVRLCDWGEPC